MARKRKKKGKGWLQVDDRKLFGALVALVLILRFPFLLLIVLLAAALVYGTKFGYRYHKQQLLANSGILDIDNMDGEEFERFLEAFFQKLGYRAKLTPYQGDYGADLIITDGNGDKTAIQAKRYHGNVGNSAIQEIVAAKNHYNCQDACVVTNSYFTRAAIKLADSNDVELWDREVLVDKLLENSSSRAVIVAEDQVDGLDVSDLQEDGLPEDEDLEIACECSECGSQIDRDDSYCSTCGCELEENAYPSCFACGAEIKKEWSFCMSCGEALGASVR